MVYNNVTAEAAWLEVYLVAFKKAQVDQYVVYPHDEATRAANCAADAFEKRFGSYKRETE